MLGAIIGDIAGSTYELRNEKDPDKILLFREGSFPTDDSVMTCAVADALLSTKGMSEEAIKEALINSMHYYGNLFPDAGYGRTFIRWITSHARNPYSSFGNGSAMRVSPVGWLFDTLEETIVMARITAEVTHNHPEGIKGAEAIATCVFLARKGYSKEKIREVVEKLYYKLDFTLDDIRGSYEFDVSCQGSVPQAIEAFLESTDFTDAIRKAISLGGDSDTIAAMTGAIAEAYYGIPEEMENKVWEALQDKVAGMHVFNDSVLGDVVRRFITRNKAYSDRRKEQKAIDK